MYAYFPLLLFIICAFTSTSTCCEPLGCCSRVGELLLNENNTEVVPIILMDYSSSNCALLLKICELQMELELLQNKNKNLSALFERGVSLDAHSNSKTTFQSRDINTSIFEDILYRPCEREYYRTTAMCFLVLFVTLSGILTALIECAFTAFALFLLGFLIVLESIVIVYTYQRKPS